MEKNKAPIKRVVEIYTVGDGIISKLLIDSLRKHYHVIINNVTSNGASENRTSFKALADISMKDICMRSHIPLTDC